MTRQQINKVLTDLQVKAMMFDLEIDWESLTLTPKVKDNTPVWIKRWNEKRAISDFDEYMDIDYE